MLHIYYGFGRGKTSTLNGTALRAISADKTVAYFRFLKGKETGENKQLLKLGIEVQNFHYTDKFTIQMNDEEKKKTRDAVVNGLNKIAASNADVILIDEFLDLKETGHATEGEMILAIQNIIKTKDVLISGHYKLDGLFKLAGLITHFEAEKHYFNDGIKAKEGIEY